MKVITIVSPDKITQSMFSTYLKTVPNVSEVVIINVNSLFSSEVQNQALNKAIDYIESTTRSESIILLIKYRIKGKYIIDSTIESKSDIIVKFDIFSTHPEVIKEGTLSTFSEYHQGWLNYVESFNTSRR